MAMTEYDHLSIKIKDAIPLIKSSLLANGRPMLWGSYGVGKTTIIKRIAQEMDFESTIVLHPSQDDVLDYKLPYLKVVTIKDGKESREEQVSAFALSERLPRSGRHVLFVDEINTAPLSLQPTLYSLILEGTIGSYKLPDECVRIAAGNREHDKCAANPMSAALKNRLFPHLNIVPDAESWCEWALQNNLRPEVIAFVKSHSLALEQADPSDPAGGCTPRGLANLSQLLSTLVTKNKDAEQLAIQGTIGRGTGAEFCGFLNVYRSAIDIDQVIENPETYPIPDGKGSQSLFYSVTTTLACRLADLDNSAKNTKEVERQFSNILKFLARVNKTYSAICITDAVTRNPKLRKRKAFFEFALEHANIIVDA